MNKLQLFTFVFAVGMCLIVLCNAGCGTKNQLKIGDRAPDFSLMDKDGIAHTLSALQGKKVALYFYPKDETPGCTQQACNIRDNFTSLADKGIVVLGMSKGSKKDKAHFTEKHHLPFTLLSATDDILKAYGVYGGFFRLYTPKRRTFLINEEGIIIDIIQKIDVKNHAQQIITGFNRIQ